MQRIVIATFDWLNEAELARIFLENNDIDVEIADSNITAAYPLLGNALGGIKLSVNELQAEKAVELLTEYDKEINANHKLWCPKCDSEDIKKMELHGVLKFLAVITVGLAAIVLSKSFKCNSCNHAWR